MAVRYAALSACLKVHVCHCNSLGGATWRSVTITGRTDRQTDGQTDGQTDRQSATQYAAPPREEGRIINLLNRLPISMAFWPPINHEANRQCLISVYLCNAQDPLHRAYDKLWMWALCLLFSSQPQDIYAHLSGTGTPKWTGTSPCTLHIGIKEVHGGYFFARKHARRLTLVGIFNSLVIIDSFDFWHTWLMSLWTELVNRGDVQLKVLNGANECFCIQLCQYL